MSTFKTLREKQKLVSKWVIGKHDIMYLIQRQNDTLQVQIFKNVNITGNQRAP